MRCPAGKIVAFPGMAKFYYYCQDDSVVTVECPNGSVSNVGEKIIKSWEISTKITIFSFQLFNDTTKECSPVPILPCNMKTMPKCDEPGKYLKDITSVDEATKKKETHHSI